jgi:acetyl-CoA acetyltransferase
VVTSAERARDLKQQPVYIMAASQACGPSLSCGTIDPTVKENETKLLARNLFSMADLTPREIDVLQVYDDFTPLVLMALEDLGFCEKGEGGDFVEGGNLEWPDGKLLLNTGGGNLSEGCIEGFNHIIEAVKQIRGVSTAQVRDAETVLVSGANGVATSGLILRR